MGLTFEGNNSWEAWIAATSEVEMRSFLRSFVMSHEDDVALEVCRDVCRSPPTARDAPYTDQRSAPLHAHATQPRGLKSMLMISQKGSGRPGRIAGGAR